MTTLCVLAIVVALLAALVSPAPAQWTAAEARYVKGVQTRLSKVWVKVVIQKVAQVIIENDPFQAPDSTITCRLEATSCLE